MAQQPLKHMPLRPRLSERHLRRIHEMALLAAGLVWLDWETIELLRGLRELWQVRSDIVYLSAFAITTGLSLFFGIILIYRHRHDRSFLPVRSYVTYMSAAIAWAMTIGALLDESIPHKIGFEFQEAIWVMWSLSIMAFLIPWAIFRPHQPTPLIIDAVLVPIAAVLGYSTLLYLLSSDPRHGRVLRIFTGTHETSYLIGAIALYFLFLVTGSYPRIRRFRIYLVYTVVILIACWGVFLIFLPRLIKN